MNNWCDEPNRAINLQALPSDSGSESTDLPAGTDCSDTGIGASGDPDVTPPVQPTGVKVEEG